MIRETHETLGLIGVLTNRWRPMLVPDQMRECVCFAFISVKRKMRPVGTAFFVGMDAGQTALGSEVSLPLLVTALHVVAKARTAEHGDGFVYIRINTHDGGAEFVKIEDELWAVPDQSPLAVDVAVCVWGHGDAQYDFKTVAQRNWLTDETTVSDSVGVGDDLFLTGLFVNHHGRERNIPVVRVGNIASMPGEPVATKLGSMEAYLVETRSVGGLSGSPVFLSLGMYRFGSAGYVQERSGGNVWSLLGVMHGHWEVPSGDTNAVVDDGLSEEYVNMGMAIVTPIQKVASLLTDPKIQEPFLEAKGRFDADQATRGLPTMDATSDEDSNEEFENFEGALTKLVNTPKPKPDA